MTRLVALAMLLSSLAFAPARADDAPSPETLQAAQELSALVTGDTINQMSAAMTAQLWPNIESTLGNRIDAATLVDLRVEFERAIAQFVNETMKSAPPVYARNFTAQELRDILAFYKTPTGAKALHTMPKVLSEVLLEMTPRAQAFQDELDAKMTAILAEHGYKN